jgi:Putative rhamnosyl transferase
LRKKIIITIAFNIFGMTDDRFTKDWIDNRIALFMNYTFKSLKAQINQDFLTLVRCEDQTLPLIDKALSKYEKLPSNIRFTGKQEYNKAFKEAIEGHDYIYLVRIDSDDMYHKTYIDQLHKYQPKPETEIIINQNGYLYDIKTQLLAPMYHYSPSFYTLIYKVEDYLKGKRYNLGGHGGAINFKHEIIPKRNFIIVVHNTNTSNSWSRMLKKQKLLNKRESKEILKQFRH